MPTLLQIGEKAPEFTLFDSDKNKVSLEDQKGKNVLLLFFPLAFTRTCTAELCSIRDNIASYNAVQAKVFGISVDSLYTLAKFKVEQNLNFSLLSDFNKEVSHSYGVLYETFSYGMKGVSKRAAFVIDKQGNIQYVEVLENSSEQPDFDRINKKLAELV
jgi:glutaredoxin-dependent peroxiredoxin